MSQMLYEICQEIKNFFTNPDTDIHKGIYKIENGKLFELYEWDPFDLRTGLTRETQWLQNGQYFRIIGSALNDGVYKYPTDELSDEIFEGAVWAMRVPPALIALAANIEEWQEKNIDAINSPYQSESFGGYSYSLRSASSSNTNNNGTLTWQSQFATRLNKWRRISVL